METGEGGFPSPVLFWGFSLLKKQKFCSLGDSISNSPDFPVEILGDRVKTMKNEGTSLCVGSFVLTGELY
jgi:hypothetical protein